MSNILKKIRNFRREESGTAVIEAIIIFPALVWVLVAMIVYFDAFRVRSVNLKAAYTISDMASRANPVISKSYINGLQKVFNFLAASNHPTWIRVTLIRFDINDVDDSSDDEHIVKYSWGTNGKSKLTTGDLVAYKSRIPVMANGDTAFIVETHTRYVPAFKIGIKASDLNNFIVTRPRFGAPCWETCIGSPSS